MSEKKVLSVHNMVVVTFFSFLTGVSRVNTWAEFSAVLSEVVVA